jgi:hypothetical protein
MTTATIAALSQVQWYAKLLVRIYRGILDIVASNDKTAMAATLPLPWRIDKRH